MSEIVRKLEKILPKNRIRARLIDRISFASDAGFYYLVPKAVVQPINEAEIIALFEFSAKNNVPLVFRTGGTSLSGQSITDGILVDLSQHWSKISVENEGKQVRVQPGAIGGFVNLNLKKYHTKIGPDPSSISTAMMGGILSNNASGMCCGVQKNSYHTLKFIRFILPNGKIYSTENTIDYQRFEEENLDIFKELVKIRFDIWKNSVLFKKIRHKYQTKNTVGYSLNSFIDFEHPLDIFAHLLVGAEGTLAFISEVVFETVPDFPYKATDLLLFSDIFSACQAILPLKKLGAEMVELMDFASLKAIAPLLQNFKTQKGSIFSFEKNQGSEQKAALLVEFQHNTEEELDQKIKEFTQICTQFSLFSPPNFTKDSTEQAHLWKLRKGLFPAVGAVRASGTTVILEDIAFPVEKLGLAIIDLQQLFKKYDYQNAIIFGHAKDGNIHFVITQAFFDANDIDRYGQFIEEVVELVLKKYDGTLKAEHGTGRNMAPFVETEWGTEAYQVMQKIKKTIDNQNILNPDVIINPDKKCHLKNLKILPAIEEEVDKCIECGFCEPKCPSRNLTMTPRRRIVARRVLKIFKKDNQSTDYQRLLKEYQYDGLDTCAVDGLCATECPVSINTGDLVKRLRNENHSKMANKFALIIANNFKTTELIIKSGLKIGFFINTILGVNFLYQFTKKINSWIQGFPIWQRNLVPSPKIPIKNHLVEKYSSGFNNFSPTKIIYFPACITRMMGNYEGKTKNLMETFLSVCQKIDVEVEILQNIQNSCCGQIFSSKGYQKAYELTANTIFITIWKSTNYGEFPVVIDVSSCAYTLQNLKSVLTEENKQKFDMLRILDSVDFLYNYLNISNLTINKKQKIALHPVCSLQKLNSVDKFRKVAQYFSHEVIIPQKAGCCGMAGDRGFLFPKLTQSATQDEIQEIKNQSFDGYYSTTKTCEIALSQSSQKKYESLLYLVDEGLQ